MRLHPLVVAAFALLLSLPALAAAAPDRAAQGQQVVTMLVKRDFAGVAKNFDAAVAKALPAEKLGQVWDQLIGQVGPFKKQLKTRVEKITQGGQQYDAVFVTCQFEKANLDVQIAYNAADKIAGLFFMPAQN
jgi:hypothetical protein